MLQFGTKVIFNDINLTYLNPKLKFGLTFSILISF